MSRRCVNAPPRILLFFLFIVPVAGIAGSELRPASEKAQRRISALREEEEKKKEGEKKEEEEKKKKKKEKKEDRFLAITGGRIHTITGPVLENVTVLCKNGKIEAIGGDVQIPAGARRIDAAGLDVYPGLIAARSSSSLIGGSNPEDSADVYGLRMMLGLAGGLTTVVTGNTAAKLTFGTLDGIVLKRELFESLSFSAGSPRSKRTLREAFERVRKHLRAVEAYERKKKTDPKAKAPDAKWIRGTYSQALKLLKREAVARVQASSTRELRWICTLARRYGFSLVIDGAREGWTLPSEIARAGASVILSPRERSDPDPSTNRPTGTTIRNAGVLHDHGVPVAIMPVRSSISTGGMAGRDLQHLPMEAAYAVRGGLPNEAAVRAITINAARILGVDHRVGSIEVGKDADFAITDGELLHYLTHVRWTIVNGRVVYNKAKESLFDHIRPDGRWDAPPPGDHWPRRLGAEW